jgi:molybdopterin-guanine dinucleotide biosynthesis protein A
MGPASTGARSSVSTPSITDAELLADFHCREGWSRRGDRWRGVRLTTLLALAGAADAAGYVTVGCGKYTAVLTREQAEDERVLLALEHEGAAGPRPAGFPRLVGPSDWDYFLSVKSVDRIEVTREPQQATAATIAPSRLEPDRPSRCGPVRPAPVASISSPRHGPPLPRTLREAEGRVRGQLKSTAERGELPRIVAPTLLSQGAPPAVRRSTIANMAHAAAIVLAGGKSSRMGSPKAALEWHGSTLLRRVTGIVARSVDGPVVVVSAPGQALPALDGAVEVVADEREGRGPLQGLLAGLAAIGDRAEVAYVSSTDVPLLHPAFVRRVVGALDDDGDVVLPEVGGYRQPLSAAYRTSLLSTVEELIAADRMRPAFLFERSRVLHMGEADLLQNGSLARLDPALASVSNLNEPADYERAHALPAPEIQVEKFGPLATRSARRRQTVRAWSLGAAAAGVDLALDEHIVAALNGDKITRDPDLPLVRGDTVAFMVADAGG